MRQPAFIIYTGPMFASKTSRLISTLDRFTRKNLNVVTFKPTIDTRFSLAQIVTHNGAYIHAECVNTGHEMQTFLENRRRQGLRTDVIGVDEAFMISGVAEVLIDWYRRGTTIVVASIQMSASLEPFAEIVKMMPWATQIEVCSAICSECDQDAYLTTAKYDFVDQKVPLVGGGELYAPLCHQHFSRLRGLRNV